jgi:hypothetical protein
MNWKGGLGGVAELAYVGIPEGLLSATSKDSCRRRCSRTLVAHSLSPTSSPDLSGPGLTVRTIIPLFVPDQDVTIPKQTPQGNSGNAAIQDWDLTPADSAPRPRPPIQFRLPFESGDRREAITPPTWLVHITFYSVLTFRGSLHIRGMRQMEA